MVGFTSKNILSIWFETCILVIDGEVSKLTFRHWVLCCSLSFLCVQKVGELLPLMFDDEFFCFFLVYSSVRFFATCWGPFLQPVFVLLRCELGVLLVGLSTWLDQIE